MLKYGKRSYQYFNKINVYNNQITHKKGRGKMSKTQRQEDDLLSLVDSVADSDYVSCPSNVQVRS